jgi:DNA invertase Pin-like site-specific DNA recombinase
VAKPAPKVPAGELKRLARIRELAAAHSRTGRALVRAIRAAHVRGISTRKIAAAAGISHANVWRTARPGTGQPGLAAEDVQLPPAPPNRADKPKRGGK